jgi:flagellar basal body rod protein FlgG
MISGLSNTVSALTAFSKKMGVTANNVANASSDGFKKSRVTLHEGAAGGVETRITKVETPGPTVMEESTEGRIQREISNVNLAEETPQTLVSKSMFVANTKVLKTEEEMLGSVLDIVG